MKLLIMQFSPTSCHFISLRSEYSPQHPVQLFKDSFENWGVLLHRMRYFRMIMKLGAGTR
jgi:hypothetical protein